MKEGRGGIRRGGVDERRDKRGRVRKKERNRKKGRRGRRERDKREGRKC